MDDDDHSDNVVGVDSHPHLLFHRMDKKDDADIVGCFHDVVVVVVVDDEELVDDEDDRVLLVVVLLHLHHSYTVEAHFCNLMWRTEHPVEDDRQSAAVAAREEDEGLLLLLFLIPPSPTPRIDD